MHRWRIDGPSIITEQKIPITFTAATFVKPTTAAIDLHEGLPHGENETKKDASWPDPLTDFFPTPLAGTIKGWGRDPATDMDGWTKGELEGTVGGKCSRRSGYALYISE